MRRIGKTGKILKNNSGETMVEVLVAFTLLSIILLLFAQGLAWATTAEARATKSRLGADRAMVLLKGELAQPNPEVIRPVTQISYFGGRVKRYTYTYTLDGQQFTYIHYEPIRTGS